MKWLFYAIATPFLNSIDSLGEKLLVEKHVKDAIVIVFNEGLLFFLFGMSILLWHRLQVVSLLQIAALLLSGMLFIYYLIPYFKALATEETSRVIPLFQFIPIFVLVLSYIFLHESISGKQLIGFFVIFSGAFFLSAEKLDGKIFKPRKAFWYMLFSSFLYGLTPILFKFVVVNTDFWTAFFYQALGGGLGALTLFLYVPYRESFFKENLKLPIKTWGIMTVNQTATIVAELSASFAFSIAPVALVSIVTGTQPLFTLIFAIILSKFFPHILEEDLSKSALGLKFSSIILILGGLILINL
ncbi:MAG: EamA family transporter [Patescibacteria group bacterium]|nr:EamA family transporter [Patescibacteria group bacterium]MDE2589822.1 EamA family transporter [Patescibacteria group bacterium]